MVNHLVMILFKPLRKHGRVALGHGPAFPAELEQSVANVYLSRYSYLIVELTPNSKLEPHVTRVDHVSTTVPRHVNVGSIERHT